jgi:hypothetical protein
VDEEDSPRTRDNDGNVRVLECDGDDVDDDGPFPVVGSSSLIRSFSFSFPFSFSFSVFLLNGRASDGIRLKADVDVDNGTVFNVVRGGVEVGGKGEDRFLPKGWVSYDWFTLLYSMKFW